MRHGKHKFKLGVDPAHRKSMMRNFAIELIDHGKMKTTHTRCKATRIFVEKLVTIAKNDTVANRRLAFNKLRSDEAVGKLFTSVAVNAKDRNGGYTRIIKAGFRPGDKADMAYMELVDRVSETESTEVSEESAA